MPVQSDDKGRWEENGPRRTRNDRGGGNGPFFCKSKLKGNDNARASNHHETHDLRFKKKKRGVIGERISEVLWVALL